MQLKISIIKKNMKHQQQQLANIINTVNILWTPIDLLHQISKHKRKQIKIEARGKIVEMTKIFHQTAKSTTFIFNTIKILHLQCIFT